jgi:tetratricopeptide (TPR) repeat protein
MRAGGPVKRLSVFALACCVVLAVASLHALPQTATPKEAYSSTWRRIVTGDLVVSGNAPSPTLTRIAGELTRFRETFRELFPKTSTSSPTPTWVVVLRDYAAFQRFAPRDGRGRPRTNVGAYFAPRADVNLIVMGASSVDGGLRTVFHEYTHYIVSRNTRGAVPLWLHEGLAEFYSTFRGDYNGQTLIGAVPPNRVRQLRSQRGIPLQNIVAGRPVDARRFYAASWALVHYVLVERPNPVATPLDVYNTTFAKTGDHDVAFTEAFGTDVAGMQRELQEYVKRVRFPALQYDIQVATPEVGTVQSMLQSDVDALQGRLLLEGGAYEEAARMLTGVVKRQPEHAAALTTLARVRLAVDREDDAISMLERVVAAAPHDGAAQYYLGTALEQAWRHEEAVAAFDRSIKLLPGNPAPWMGLNGATRALRRDAQASAALQIAMQLEYAPEKYWAEGLQAFRLGRDELAAAAIKTFVELRGNGEDTSVYPLFVRALAARRAGRATDADEALATAATGDMSDAWTRTVLQFLQGQVDDRKFLRQARHIGQETQARTYLGFKLALAGRDAEAVAHYRWVVERGATNYVEYLLARNELNRRRYAK